MWENKLKPLKFSSPYISLQSLRDDEDFFSTVISDEWFNLFYT